MIMKIVQFTSKKSWSKMINFQKEDLRYLKNSLEWMLICEHDNIIGNNQMRI
jgi:hypothetical protein